MEEKGEEQIFYVEWRKPDDPVIAREGAQRIHDLRLWTGELRKEVEWWTRHRESCEEPEAWRFNKPITITLCDLASMLQQLMRALDSVVRVVDEAYSEAGRQSPVKPLNRAVRRRLNDALKQLEPIRGKVAAHWLTDRAGTYLSLPEAVQYLSRLGKVTDTAAPDIFQCHDMVGTWLDSPVNANHLVLAALDKRAQRPGLGSRT
ncbi:MAG: hypothetical protein KAW17_01805 [Candidatus Eisenbacteria sp.]|nr:hypothetical protein [Candidatus Eisenbacteria bacterium]